MKLASRIFKRDDWYITSSFGYRDPINTNAGVTSKFHNGCDYGTHGQKWPQYALEDGIIIECGVGIDGGKYIWIDYPRIKKKFLHYHLDSILVKKNQIVDENTILGYTGQTGKATGVHLHLSMKDSNGSEYQNPEQYEYKKKDFRNYNCNDNIDKLAMEVIAGKWGNGQDRISRLSASGHNPIEIQKKVNALLTDNNNYVKYIVKEGDTLEKIGKKYDVAWQDIYIINKDIIGSNPNLIRIGLELKIRKG